MASEKRETITGLMRLDGGEPEPRQMDKPLERFRGLRLSYYDRKRGQGKRHNQALIALAHRRLTVLFAMIRDGSLYDVPELKIA